MKQTKTAENVQDMNIEEFVIVLWEREVILNKEKGNIQENVNATFNNNSCGIISVVDRNN